MHGEGRSGTKLHTTCPDGRAGAVVLLVDDDADFRTLLREALEVVADEAGSTRPQIIEAADGTSGLQTLRGLTTRAHLESVSRVLVCVDGEMPALDGLGMLQQVREEHLADRVEVLMVSGSTDPRLPDSARRLGAAEFYIKPQTGSGLIAFARQALLPRLTAD